MRYLSVLSLLALPLALAACDGGVADEPDVQASTFEATLQGALDARLEGEAWLFDRSLFDASDLDLPPGFDRRFMPTSATLSARTGDGTFHNLVLSFYGEAVPEPGTYEVGGALAAMPPLPDSSANPFYYRETVGGAPLVTYARGEGDVVTSYLFSSGTVEITAATDERLEGTFSVEAEQAHAFAVEAFEVPIWQPLPGDGGLAPDPETEVLDPPLRVTGTFKASKRARPAGR